VALSDIVTRTRSILYGTGLGEKPAIRIAASNANETTSGQLVTFTVVAGEGAELAPGQVVSVYDPATELDAHVVYITSTSTDAITGINGYLGSPVVIGSNSGDLDDALQFPRRGGAVKVKPTITLLTFVRHGFKHVTMDQGRGKAGSGHRDSFVWHPTWHVNQITLSETINLAARKIERGDRFA